MKQHVHIPQIALNSFEAETLNCKLSVNETGRCRSCTTATDRGVKEHQFSTALEKYCTKVEYRNICSYLIQISNDELLKLQTIVQINSEFLCKCLVICDFYMQMSSDKRSIYCKLSMMQGVLT